MSVSVASAASAVYSNNFVVAVRFRHYKQSGNQNRLRLCGFSRVRNNHCLKRRRPDKITNTRPSKTAINRRKTVRIAKKHSRNFSIVHRGLYNINTPNIICTPPLVFVYVAGRRV